MFFGFYGILKADSSGGVNCEPSLIFPEMFMLESVECFSHYKACELYSGGSRTLRQYLDRFIDSREQTIYRYLDYLRGNENLPAMMTLMVMTSNDITRDYISDPVTEFNNLILLGIKESERAGGGKLVPLSSSTGPLTAKALSNNFFSAFSYIASYLMENSRQDDIDAEIIERSFNYIISNIQQGIDWDEDIYLNRLFNSFVRMKNGRLLNSFTKIFYFYLKGSRSVPSFVDYTKLRDLGMTKDLKPGYSKTKSVIPEQRVIASFFLDNINETGDVIFTSNMDDIKYAENNSMCDYLDKRGEWLEGISHADPSDNIFNESVKIAEQCPGSFQLPFKLKNGTVFVHENAKWITDLAFALNYIMKENLTGEDVNIIIEGSLRSSLNKNRYVYEKRLAEDILSYVFETGNGLEMVKALFSRNLPSESEKGGDESVTDAAEIISKILF
jgi:hypothetical protein